MRVQKISFQVFSVLFLLFLGYAQYGLCASELSTAQEGAMGCRDADNHPVDWWVIIKTPMSYTNYYYHDASTTQPFVYRTDLNELNSGALANTVQQIYQNPGVSYGMYNDETESPADKKVLNHESAAHAKGLFGFDEGGGFWLLHSAPVYPRDQVGKDKYSGLTKNLHRYAQSFFCVSLPKEELNRIGSMLRVSKPYMYQSNNLPSSFSAETKEPTVSFALRSRGGVDLIALSKSKSWGQEFYTDLLAPHLQTGLRVTSWLNDLPNFPSLCAQQSCSSADYFYLKGKKTNKDVCEQVCAATGKDDCEFQYNVENIMGLQFSSKDKWNVDSEHSKWAITESGGKHYFCIADNNRQEPQTKRGGNALCIEQPDLWSAFDGVVNHIDGCAAN